MNDVGLQVVQVEIDVITLLTNTSAGKNFHGHGAGDDVSGGEILGSRGISLHETFTVLVSENTTLTTAALGHQATGTVDTSGMELDEFRVLNGDTGSGNHTTTITSAGVGGGAALVGTTVATSGHDGLLGSHTMDGTIGNVVGHNTAALTIFHDQVHSEVLDEENAVVTKSTAEEGVQHGVTGTIGDSAASVGLTTFAVLLRLTTKSTLVNLTLSGSAERHAVGLELSNSDGGLTSHVLDGVLISKPITTLHSIVEVPSPVVVVHVAEGCVDATLSGDSVRSSREQLGNASGLETSLGETESGSETGTTSTDNKGIVSVVNDSVVTNGLGALNTVLHGGVAA